MPLHENERPLLDVLTHPDSVLFLGSGISTWSGLPNWSQLLSGLMTACERRNGGTRLARDALARGDLLDAADKLTDVMTPLEMATTLREDLGFARSRPHEIHRLLTNLGPERFVTTNFDNLIEQQLGLEGRLGDFRTVTNRQVAELADIQKASANRFIFKPHGDLAEAEGLVLSTTQYDRILLGSANLVRPVLETLFVSRPILFIGYGLRDPDMMLLVRSLKERYNGNAGEFWAIIADASEELTNYWWRQHRIRIVSYSTKKDTDKLDHRPLLELLRRLSDGVKEKVEAIASTRNRTIDAQHGLISYAARLIRPTPAVSFPIRVLLHSWIERGRFPTRITNFHGSNVADLLAQSTDTFILMGPAGSGKSFAISDRLARAGRQILDWCLAGDKKAAPPPIPVLLDARLYRGDFAPLIAATVPASVDLANLSRAHLIILILDSLDEMPSEYLDSAQWRSELDSLVSNLQNVCVHFGTRRADLVSDATLPVFLVDLLDEEVVEASLGELGRSRNDLTLDLAEALRTPFTLILGRRFLGASRDIASAPALFSKFLGEALKPVARHSQTAQSLPDRLSRLASGVLASGRDTLSIEQAALELSANSSQRSKGTSENRWLVDRLVDAGIFVSEIDSHIRFVHRSVTEFLAAKFLVNGWHRKEVRLDEVLSVRRWDNAAAWASTLLAESEAQLFLREVYSVDRELAAAIARAAEIGKTHVWSTLLDLLIASPATEDQQRNIAYWLEDSLVPEEALPKLKLLAERNDELGGWAISVLIRKMSEPELVKLINRLGTDKLAYNFINFFGPALGRRIEVPLLDHFLQSLDAANFSTEDSKAEIQHGEISYRSGYHVVIGGMPKPTRDNLISWSRTKSASIRGIICEGIRDIDDDPSIQKYLVAQFDRGVPEAVFALFLGINYKKGQWRRWFLNCTDRRANRLLTAIRSNADKQRWAMELLRCLAKRDENWNRAFANIARTEDDVALRRVIRALISAGKSVHANQIVSRALKNPKTLSPVERVFCHLMDEFHVEVDEDEVLDALHRDVRGTLRLLSDMFFGPAAGRYPIKVVRIQDWIHVLHGEFSSSDWVNEHTLLSACGYLAKALRNDTQKKIIHWANQPKHPARDFVIGLIVPRISGITTDDLELTTGHRLLELYIKGKIEAFPSPGEIATERFITDIVLPYAQSLGEDHWERAAVEQVLLDAGRRHDRRYRAPWAP